jgi:prepilin-type processing-associated H-X9-DG protein
MSSKEFTLDDITQHNKEGDLWIVIDSKVYDLSRFADLHPGGAGVLYADGVGKCSDFPTRLSYSYRPQLGRMLLRFSLDFTDLRFSNVLSMHVSK